VIGHEADHLLGVSQSINQKLVGARPTSSLDGGAMQIKCDEKVEGESLMRLTWAVKHQRTARRIQRLMKGEIDGC